MKKNLKPILASLAVLGVIIFVIMAVSNPKNDSSGSSDGSAVTATPAQKAQMAQGYAKGDLSSKVVVTEFGDFQCPACQAFYDSVLEPTILPQYGDKIKFVFKHFPLTQIHANAMASAEAAEAAGAQGKFWEMYDQLYTKSNHDNWAESADPTSYFITYAGNIGLNTNKFKSDITAKKYEAAINKDLDLATKLKLPGTPSIFVNGVFIDNANMSPQQFGDAIINAIKAGLGQ